MPEVYELGFNFTTVNVTLSDALEDVVVSSGDVVVPFQTTNVFIAAWAQWLAAADSTSIIPAIRRGNTRTGTLVGERHAITVESASAANRQIFIMAQEPRADIVTVEYSLTLEQASPTEDTGTFLQGAILVFMM